MKVYITFHKPKKWSKSMRPPLPQQEEWIISEDKYTIGWAIKSSRSFREGFPNFNFVVTGGQENCFSKDQNSVFSTSLEKEIVILQSLAEASRTFDALFIHILYGWYQSFVVVWERGAKKCVIFGPLGKVQVCVREIKR